MILRKTYFFYIFFIFSTILFDTQAQDLKFWHLTVNEGLSNSAINCFLQDSQGYMWIATQDGLNRYDGYKVEIFRRETKNKYTFTENYINTVYEDANQNIWVTTNGGGAYQYDRQLNKFDKIKEIPNGSTWIIAEDSQKKLWISAHHVLYYKNDPSSPFKPYPQFTTSSISGVMALSD
jgi:ligand-binding sensor domain-containing protein